MLIFYAFFVVYLISKKDKNFILIAILLLLLANHHLYGVFASISILIYLVLQSSKKSIDLTVKERKHLLIAGAILIIGCLFIYWQYGLTLKHNRFTHLGQAPYFMTVRAIWNAFFPIPDTFGMHFWDSNILSFPTFYRPNTETATFITTGNIVAVFFSLLILLTGVTIFSKSPPVLLAFLVNTFIQLTFLQYLSIFYIRYQGFLFIIFIYCYWLLLKSEQDISATEVDALDRVFYKSIFIPIRRLCPQFFRVVFFIHFCIGAFVYIQDIRHPFSSSYKAAEYIKEQKLDNCIMVGYKDILVQPIAAYLNQEIYYPQSRDFGTYVDCQKRKSNIPLDRVLSDCIRLINEHKKTVLLILNSPLMFGHNRIDRQFSLNENIKMEFIQKFTESIVTDERYFLYSIYAENMDTGDLTRKPMNLKK